MKSKITLLGLLLFASYSITAQEVDDQESTTANPIIGNWTIDLRPTPESDAYFQSFVVEAIEGKSIVGTFYGSEISQGLINMNWPKIYFAFSTSDQSNEYYHSGYLENGQLFGISYCPGRDFTAPWTGTKK